MIAKRIAALVVMAMLSTVSPAVYQKGLEPRLGALDSQIKINSFDFDAARSGKDVLCYKSWITVMNPNPYEVILSELDLDMFYATTFVSELDGSTQQRYVKIGSFNTTQEYTVPASKGVDVPQSEWGAIASFDEQSHKIYNEETGWGTVNRTTGGQWTDQLVFAYLYFSTQYEGNATEIAISELLASGSIIVSLQGDLIIGPFKIPYSLSNVELNLDIWDQEVTIVDIVGAYRKDVGTAVDASNVYFVHAIMHNPSGNPFLLRDYRFDLYVEGVPNPTLIANGIDSRYLAEIQNPNSAIYDPDLTQLEGGSLTRVALKDVAWGTYYDSSKTWSEASVAVTFAPGETEQDVILPLNFTSEANFAMFMSRLLDEDTIYDLELKGTAKVGLGTYGQTGTINGIEVNFGSPSNWRTASIRYNAASIEIDLDQLILSQHSETGSYNIAELMQLGSFQVTKIEVNKDTNQTTMTALSNVNFTNPYRIEMNFTQYSSKIHEDDDLEAIGETNLFSSGTENRIIQLQRAHRSNTEPTALPAANTTVVQTNVTIGYNTNNYITSSGLGQIYHDIGFIDDSGSIQLFNLTNPFRVLGLNGVKLEDEDGAAPNWMQLVDYLIANNVDPLMLLHEVNTTSETHTDVAAYAPLLCSSFGTEEHTVENGVVIEPEDFPSTNGNQKGLPNYDRPYHTPYEFDESGSRITWGNYWDDEMESPGGEGYGLKKNDPTKNQWVFAAASGGTGPDYDTFNYKSSSASYVTDWAYFQGAIWRNGSGIGVSSTRSPISATTSLGLYPEQMAWRFSVMNADDYRGQFGYWYDFVDQEKGYYISSQGEDWFLARQNFTLPAWLKTGVDNGTIEIQGATLSMSYRYPEGHLSGKGDAVLGISNQTQSVPSDYKDKTFDYLRQMSGQTDYSSASIDGAQYFWNATYPGNKDWTTTSHDVTNLILEQLSYMPAANASKIEVAFGRSGGSGITWDTNNAIDFDDIALRIEYKNTEEQGTLTAYELFSYIEQNDAEDGNLWNMLDQANFNATKFTSFLEGTLGNEAEAGTGINFIDFMKQSGANAETIPDVLQNNYLDIGGTEAVNFLQMLNQTQYVATKVDPINAFGEYDVNTTYGPRNENLENWVVSDPLKASQTFAKALMESLYTKAGGTFLTAGDSASGDVAGEELWNMFENLDTFLPWICMYLIQKGWSKDDIFDMLEAIGFGSEVRYENNHNFYNSKATGSLLVVADLAIRIRLNVIILGTLGPFDMSTMDDPIVATFKLGMGETLLDPVTDLYFLLAKAGFNQDVDGDGAIGSNEYYSIPLQVSSASLDTVEAYPFYSERNTNVPGWGINWVELSGDGFNSEIGIRNYTLGLWLTGKSSQSSYAPEVVPTVDLTSYTTAGEGLTTGGVQQLFQNLRQNVKFQGSTFLQTGGNPVSLFQFLDDAFFFEKHPTGDSNPAVDYSSYTLFNHYGVKGIDLLEILTDYNRTAGVFDARSNGICDEWSVPTEKRYWESSTFYNSSFSGFGINYRDCRIFNASAAAYPNCLDYVTARNGTIMWTDSPNLAKTQGDAGVQHALGNVYLNSSGDHDNFEKGAPPVVNLIDMLAWLSVVTGKPDPEMLLQWLTGQLPDTYYDCIGNGNPTNVRLGVNATGNGVNKGLGPDKTWSLFKNMTMNATGMMNWLENVKKVHPFQFLYLINQTDQAMSPLQLLFYASMPNYILNPDGSVSYNFHSALGTTQALAEDNIWKLFNSTWWAEKDPDDPLFDFDGVTSATFVYQFYEQLRGLETDGNTAFNLFTMLEALDVDPVSWLNVMQWKYGIKPLELFAVFNTLNYDWAITNRTGGRSRVFVNCTVKLEINGWDLTTSAFNWQLEDRYLTADYNLRNFIIAANLYQDSYVYYPYAGSV